VVTPAKHDAKSRKPVEQSILVVDPDRLSSTLISRMLERAGYAVEVVGTGVAALDVLGSRSVAMMIAETQLPDLPLASLVARTRQLYTPMLPVIAISANIRPMLRVETIRLGVELVAKPVDPEELRARLDLALRTSPVTPSAPAAVLSGELATFSLHDIFAMLELARFTGQVQVSSGREVGACYLAHGRPYHAAFGKLVGMDAFAAIVGFARGWFRVHPGATTERSLEGSMTHVILHAAVENAHRRRTPSSIALRLDELGVTKFTATGGDEERERLARRLGMAVGDAFRIGELEVGPRTAEPRDGNVIELAMFGDVSELVMAMWELSAPIGPAALIAVTRPGSVLTWRFAGRGPDRLVVRLISHDEPAAGWLNSSVDGIVILPPDHAHPLDPALRPFVQRNAAPVVIVGEPRETSLLSPAPFNTIRWTGRAAADLRGQARDILRQVLSLIAEVS
jgi:CheY-like chemotaxis protein